MKYSEAKKIQKGSTVIHKYTHKRLSVTEMEIDKTDNSIYFKCNDGELYHHRTLDLPIEQT